MRKTIALLFAAFLLSASAPEAQDAAVFRKPQARDKCPVCGMFVAKYPDWTAEILFTDGSYAVFDGAKDLFKYYHGMAAYAPGRNKADISAIFVTDYYSVQPVDGRRAFFVQGSDVYGPMGKELVPFGKESDAREFLQDHNGKRVLSFSGVTPEIVKELDQ
jgi:nitrous oxide reductase accessory protein NosL